MRSVRILLVLVAIVAGATAAGACPFCNSDTAAQVRALAFGPDFLRYLASTLAPVPILLALVAIGSRLGDWLAPHHRRSR